MWPSTRRRRRAVPSFGAGLDAAAAWLARAQDAGDDDGVAAFYDIKARRWKASYPETTGYIIPTLYRYSKLSGRDEYFDRAKRMADWESDIQLAGGGVRAGNMDAEIVAPTVFNTGQVLFGWASAYEHTGRDRFADSLKAAADWLVAAQDADGAWRRFGSPFASHAVNTYNTRTAAGLARAHEVLGEHTYADAASANIDWALNQQSDNGWFAHNDLEDNERPLTHTIAYAMRGILEAGALLGRPDYIDRAAATAAPVARTQRRDGALPGRLDREWRPAARWSCLTGNAQMAMVWLRLAELGYEGSWTEPARGCIDYLQSAQFKNHPDPGQWGGIGGSQPLRGDYMRHRIPNWAVKFYMDALMQFERKTEASTNA